MYLARDKTLNDLVAIKKVRILVGNETFENESQMLKECISRYIVRYYGMIRKPNELWVWVVALSNGADYHGVLPQRFHRVLSEEGKPVK